MKKISQNLSQKQKFLRKIRKNFFPPERLKISEWAEKYRVLSPEASNAPGYWRNSRVPYLVEIMDAVTDPEVEEITVCSSAQIGKTELIINIILYYIDKEPCPILLVCPTLAFAENYSHKRISPAIRDCSVIAEKFPKIKSRDTANTLLYKEFPGGNITMSGSNSPSSLASHPIRLFIVEELDRTENTKEGDSVALGEKRTNNFYNRKKIKVSTPTMKYTSKIIRTYEKSSQESFHVECPFCGHFQVLNFHQVIFKNEKGEIDPKTARYRCCSCFKDWSEFQRYNAIRSGKWIAKHPERKMHRGFGKLSELYSLWRSLEQIVVDFLEKKDNPETLQVFVNTTLGEEFEIKGAAPEWQKLYNRREDYKNVPKGVCFLTAGVDVQEDRVHCEIVGWGRNFETWSIDYQVFYGDTSSLEPWEKLAKYISRVYMCEDGRKIGILRLCIDAGFNTQHVHNFARKYSFSQVVCVVGRDNQNTIVSTPQKIDINKAYKRYGSFRSMVVGSSLIKKELYGFLRQEKTSANSFPFGYAHFPSVYGEQYFLELTAEELHKDFSRGFPKFYWKKTRERNEALDCRVYSRAAAYLVGIDRFDERDFLRIEEEEHSAITVRKTIENYPMDSKERDQDNFWRD